MKAAVLGAKWSPCAEPIDQMVVPATGLPSASVQVKAVPPHSWTSIPRCRLYQACSAGASLALKKMPPMPVTRFIESPRTGGGEGVRVFCGLTVKLSGRSEAPAGSRGRTLSPRARGAKPLTHHGPSNDCRESRWSRCSCRQKCLNDFIHSRFKRRYRQRPLKVGPRTGIRAHGLVRLAALPLCVHSDLRAIEAAVQRRRDEPRRVAH